MLYVAICITNSVKIPSPIVFLRKYNNIRANDPTQEGTQINLASI